MLVSTEPQQRERFEEPILFVGRYAVFDEIASGGFATVHLGRAVGAGGFARTVAIKRLHGQYARDPEVSAMFLDEAKIVARIRHPNVLPTLDLISEDNELFLVMEYVEGVPLSFLMRHARKRKRLMPPGVALRILCGALHGLHAAHEARDERGEMMNLVHRDVSPDNILVGIDGMPRLLDFGVAKALGQFHATREGEVKGKLAYITPEQVKGDPITRRSDVFSASVVLWEAMTGKRLFRAKSIAAIAHNLLTQQIPPPSEIAGTPKKLDGIVLQGLERDPDKRWSSAERMAAALEAVGELASQPAVARYVRQAGAERIVERHKHVAKVEAANIDTDRFNTRASQTDVKVSASELQKAKDALAEQNAEAPVTEPLTAPSLSSTPSVAPIEATPDPIALGDAEAPRAPKRRWALPIGIGVAITIGVIAVMAQSDGADESAAPASSTTTGETQAIQITSAPAPSTEPSVAPSSETTSSAPATSAASSADAGVAPTASVVAPTTRTTAPTRTPTKPPDKGGLYGRD